MIILIDGYNVLKRVAREVSERDRQNFVSRVAAYAERKKHTCIIVFDGGQVLRTTKVSTQGIDLVYSGPDATADDVLIDLMHAYKDMELIVVTYDRELVDRARRVGAVVVEPDAWQAILRGEAAPLPDLPARPARVPIRKTSTYSNPELDRLMAELGGSICHKDDDMPRAPRIAPSHKPSKEERYLIALLKKL